MSGYMPSSHLDFEAVHAEDEIMYRGDDPVIDYLFKNPWSRKFDLGILDKYWDELFGEEWIPWKIEDRKTKFPNAYKKLTKYIEFHEKN
jgi:hypothetical protein